VSFLLDTNIVSEWVSFMKKTVTARKLASVNQSPGSPIRAGCFALFTNTDDAALACRKVSKQARRHSLKAMRHEGHRRT